MRLGRTTGQRSHCRSSAIRAGRASEARAPSASTLKRVRCRHRPVQHRLLASPRRAASASLKSTDRDIFAVDLTVHPRRASASLEVPIPARSRPRPPPVASEARASASLKSVGPVIDRDLGPGWASGGARASASLKSGVWANVIAQRHRRALRARLGLIEVGSGAWLAAGGVGWHPRRERAPRPH